jgi:hypothetical protein
LQLALSGAIADTQTYLDVTTTNYVTPLKTQLADSDFSAVDSYVSIATTNLQLAAEATGDHAITLWLDAVAAVEAVITLKSEFCAYSPIKAEFGITSND